MPKKRLTEEGVSRLRPPSEGKQVDYYDTAMPGLILRVNYGGAKVFRALHYIKKLGKDGRRITVPTTTKLGRHPTLTVKEARERCRQFDPEKPQVDDGSFMEVAENFLRRHVAHEGLRSQPEIERVLRKYVYPRWGHRPFRNIKRNDVALLLDEVSDNHGPSMADIVLAYVRKLMNWFSSRDNYYVSPIVRGMNRSKKEKRSRILNDDEIRNLWRAADGTFGALLKVALLTAQREGKVSTMKWPDINDDGVWTIPSEKREKSNAGSLQLPQVVLDIINGQPKFAGNAHVFAAVKGDGPFNSFSQRKRELDEKISMPHWTVHDLRRTARSLLSRAGVRPDISERVLGHAIPGIAQVYDRHSYDVEKAHALRELAALVERIINPPPKGKVVRMDERKRKRA